MKERLKGWNGMKLRKIVAIVMMLMLLCVGALAEEPTEGQEPNPATNGGNEATSHTRGDGEEVLPEITVRLVFSFEGDVLTEGTKMTIRAIVENVPEGMSYRLQWQNDLTGEFADVPKETGEKIEIDATEENAACAWRVLLYTDEATGDA